MRGKMDVDEFKEKSERQERRLNLIAALLESFDRPNRGKSPARRRRRADTKVSPFSSRREEEDYRAGRGPGSIPKPVPVSDVRETRERSGLDPDPRIPLLRTPQEVRRYGKVTDEQGNKIPTTVKTSEWLQQREKWLDPIGEEDYLSEGERSGSGSGTVIEDEDLSDEDEDLSDEDEDLFGEEEDFPADWDTLDSDGRVRLYKNDKETDRARVNWGNRPGFPERGGPKTRDVARRELLK